MSESRMPQSSTDRSLIRRARHSDEAALGRLDRETWSTLHSVQPPPAPPYEPFFDANHHPDDILVAEEFGGWGGWGGPGGWGGRAGQGGTGACEGVLLGYVRVVPPSRLACHQHVRQIQGLAVSRRARGRGTGRALVRAACAEARRQGAVRITLRVLGHNAPARALYESEGFVVEGVLPGEFWIAGRYADDVLMGRGLA